jgi:trimeric autotransporter adhesin
MGVVAGLLLPGCVPHLTGAPCHADDNCPVNQYCDGTNCQAGTPPATRVVQLLVSTPAGILPLGATVQATATAVLQSGDQEDVTTTAVWSTNDTRVAQVSNDAGTQGSVLAVATGEVDVSATLGANSGSAHLVVTNAELVSLVVTVDRPVVAARTDLTCTAMGFFTDGTHADLSSLASWSSSQPGVVSVSTSPGNIGALVALSPGTAQISATYQQFTGATGVVVTNATLTGVAISPLLPYVATGTSTALQATGLFSDGTAQPMTGSVQWTVDDPSLAFFLSSGPGVLQGFAAGTTLVAAQAGALMAQAPLLVSAAPLVGLEVAPALPDTLGVGGAATFGAWATFADEGVLDVTSQASWNATDTSVLAVLPVTGAAAALDAGASDVQAGFGGLLASATQSVDGSAPSALLVWPPSAPLTVGLPGLLAAERVLADGSVDDVTQLAGWTSSCPTQVEVATGARGGEVATRAQKTCNAKAQFEGLYGTSSVVAVSRSVQRIEITPEQAAIGPGGRVAHAATAIFVDGTLLDVTPLASWTSSAAGVVLAGNGFEAGQALAADAGSSQLSASFGGASATASVTVGPQVATLEVWPPLALVHTGTRRALAATAVWPTGDAIDVTAWTTYASTLPDAAAVANAAGARGVLSALGPGTAQVTAQFGTSTAHAAVAVDAATPTALTVTGPSALPEGEPGAFQAVAHFSDGSTAQITGQAAWTSSAPSVVRLRGTGPLRGSAVAVSTGSATAQARFSGVGGAASVAASPAGLQSLSIQSFASPLPLGVQLQLAASANFPSGTQLDVTTRAVWTSSSPEVASISSGARGGRLEALQPGSTTVTVAFEGGQASASVTVSSASLTTVTILPAQPTGAIGMEVPLQARGGFADGSFFDLTQQARWSSANAGLVAVSNGETSRGSAMALGQGAASLFASVVLPGTTAITGSTSFVGTTAVPVGIEILPQKVTLSLTGSPSIALHANAHLSDGTVHDVSAQVSWSVENASVAEVSASGQLTALKVGNATVLSSLGTLVGSAAVDVTP